MKKKKIMGCKGGLCALKQKCKKFTNFIKNRYTTFYSTVPYNHTQKKCNSYEGYEEE